MLLKDVKVLTLYKDRMTNYRRVSAVPQLECSSGCEYFHPDTVQCLNQGNNNPF